MDDKKDNERLFGEICDIIASDRLVCITGAGISSTLRQEKDKYKNLPTWLELLRRLYANLKDDLTNADDIDDIQRLITDGASGMALIEAASILRKGREKKWFLAILSGYGVKFNNINL